MTDRQNKENVEKGQQGTNKPWKEPSEHDGRNTSAPDVVEQELQKKPGGGAPSK